MLFLLPDMDALLYLLFIGIKIRPIINVETTGTIIIAVIPKEAATTPIIMEMLPKPIYRAMNSRLELKPVFCGYQPLTRPTILGIVVPLKRPNKSMQIRNT